MRWPKGTARYACYPDGGWRPQPKLLAFASEKAPALSGASLSNQFSLVFNDFLFDGESEEGTYVWTITAHCGCSPVCPSRPRTRL